MKPSIDLHIEELVLHGFSRADRYRIAEAIEHELVQLFSKQEIPPALLLGGEIAYLDGRAFQVQPGTRPDTIGAQVAQALYGGLSNRFSKDHFSPAHEAPQGEAPHLNTPAKSAQEGARP